MMADSSLNNELAMQGLGFNTNVGRRFQLIRWEHRRGKNVCNRKRKPAKRWIRGTSSWEGQSYIGSMGLEWVARRTEIVKNFHMCLGNDVWRSYLKPPCRPLQTQVNSNGRSALLKVHHERDSSFAVWHEVQNAGFFFFCRQCTFLNYNVSHGSRLLQCMNRVMWNLVNCGKSHWTNFFTSSLSQRRYLCYVVYFFHN